MNNILRIIFLRSRTDENGGNSDLVSSINACSCVVDVIRSTLGPRGMDKFILDSQGNTTISNDGATVMKLLEIIHPAAQILVNIASSQDSIVGDGTTSVVILTGEILREAMKYVKDGIHPRVIIKSFRCACRMAIAHIRELSISVSCHNKAEMKQLLKKCAMTSVNSKLISEESSFFSDMVVDAVCRLDTFLPDMNMIGIKKVQGGSLKDSILIVGVAFKKTFSYAGFEQQPKKLEKPKILLLNLELELKAERSNAEIRMNDPSQYQSFVDAEWKIIYEKLSGCVRIGANVVLSRLAIGDLATQYFADRGIFCAGRVAEDDLARTAEATGAKVQANIDYTDKSVLGTCGLFEEKSIGCERYNLFTECPMSRTATLILRGGSMQFIDEVSRSLNDAIMIVKKTLMNPYIVPGGGAIDMQVSKHLREKSKMVVGKEQIFINAFAKALEAIPNQLCENAGLDSNGILTMLRQKHSLPLGKGRNFGIDIYKNRVCDTYNSMIWEPSIVKINVITNATEAACMILSVDKSIRNQVREE